MKYAGFWRRAAAHVLDSILLNLLSWGVETALFGAMYGVYWVLARHNHTELQPFSDAFNPVFEQIASVVIYLALAGPYFVWGTYRYGTTLGKKPLRIFVVREADGAPITLKQSFWRFVGYLPSYLAMGCGFFMVALNPQKRGLHDLLAGTVSVVKAHE